MPREPKPSVGEVLRETAATIDRLKGDGLHPSIAQSLRRCAVRHERLERLYGEVTDDLFDTILGEDARRLERDDAQERALEADALLQNARAEIDALRSDLREAREEAREHETLRRQMGEGQS
jgi:hypothetical protein